MKRRPGSRLAERRIGDGPEHAAPVGGAPGVRLRRGGRGAPPEGGQAVLGLGVPRHGARADERRGRVGGAERRGGRRPRLRLAVPGEGGGREGAGRRGALQGARRALPRARIAHFGHRERQGVIVRPANRVIVTTDTRFPRQCQRSWDDSTQGGYAPPLLGGFWGGSPFLPRSKGCGISTA